MNCDACKKRWEKVKSFVSRKLFGHECNYVQMGIWSDKYYTCKPLMRCTICGNKKKVGMDD